jgi:diaminopimelate decarboxylase
MQIPKISHIKLQDAAAENVEKWTLCGSLCTTADVLTRNAELAGLSMGDVLVFERTGAYSVMEGMAVFLSREMPQINLYSKQTGLTRVRDLIYTDRFNTPVVLG